MPDITVNRITIATKDTGKMLLFYGQVFEVEFRAFEAMGFTLHEGTLGGMGFMFCPNEILNIQAEKNNIQLTLTVPDLSLVLERVETHGGKQIQPIEDNGSVLATGITDPDGNTLELCQIKTSAQTSS